MVSAEYLAGLIDGDGSISLTKYRKTKKIYTRVQLSQKDTEDFRALASALGRPTYRANPGMVGVQWSGKAAEILLLSIGPFLRLKRKQWILVQSFIANRSLGWVLSDTIQTLNKDE